MLIKEIYIYLNNTTALKNNVIDVFNNCIRATDAIIKCPSYLLSSKAILSIQYRTTRFENICTKSWDISLFN